MGDTAPDREGPTSDTSRSPLEDEAEQDLSFGGVRDWLLVAIGGPMFVAILLAGAMLGIGSGGGRPLTPTEAVAAVAAAVVVALVWSRVRRRR